MHSVIDYDSKTVTLEHALEVCSMFASQEPNKGTENVCVRRSQVEGTNGHVLLVLPIEQQTWLEMNESRLMPAGQAMVESQASQNVQQVVMAIPSTDGKFPDTQQYIRDFHAQPFPFSILADPFYLELIGKAFGMLRVQEVQIRFRGEAQAIEFIGMIDKQPIGKAFLMPRKPH